MSRVRVAVSTRRRRPRLIAELERAAAQAVRAGAADLRDTARDLLDMPGGGRPSMRSTASAPMGTSGPGGITPKSRGPWPERLTRSKQAA